MKISLVIQARNTSSRLKNKHILKVNNQFLIEYLILRLKKSKFVNSITLATTRNKTDDIFEKLTAKHKINLYRGDEKNVLKRVFFAVKNSKPDLVVRITGDCPLLDFRILDKMIELFLRKKSLDFMSNGVIPTFPDGMDIAIMTFNALKKTYTQAKSKIDKENVTSYIYKSKKFKLYHYKYHLDYSNLRITIDDFDDFEVIEFILKKFVKNIYFSLEDILSLSKKYPDIFNKNIKTSRNIGAKLSKDQKLWIRSKSIIPNGNMMLSKRPERFLPYEWPPYYKKAKGCYIWDYENKKYLDMYLMGVGTNILGYANDVVNSSVIKKIKYGNISSLNSREDLDLAEKLIELNKWASCVSFARTGAEAASISLRIARAYSNSSKVAICGYHGWHDWYLAANLQNKEKLNTHLIKNLTIDGIPKELKDLTHTFFYNDFEGFKEVVEKNNIKIVMMEVMRNLTPKNNFLKKIERYCLKNNLILIFDECTTGFREIIGGLYKKFNVKPDIVIFGKAIANGYPMIALVYKKKFLNSAKKNFISSTFWTERLGPTAALKTIEIMEKEKIQEKLVKKGKIIKNKILKISKRNKIKLKIFGLNTIIKLKFKSRNPQLSLYIFTRMMLQKNILAGDTIYLSIAHTNKEINIYLKEMNKIFKYMASKKIDKVTEKEFSKINFQKDFSRLN
jgi:glutamate-1-semialdehyde 2,1-aminomutase